jgi:hypothetical protein
MTDHSTKWAFAAFAAVVAFVLILAFYGYLSGAWRALE